MRVAARATFFRVADFQSLWFILRVRHPQPSLIDGPIAAKDDYTTDGSRSEGVSPQPWLAGRAERESRKLCRISTAAT